MKAIRWMAYNKVAPNLLMLLLLIGGYIASRSLKVEIFPEFEMDRVLATMAYPGASPEEVEDALVLPIEEAINSVDNIRRVQSVASEGYASVSIELVEGSDVDAALQDVKSAIDRIVTFPQEAERPIVRKVVPKRAVLTVAVYGDLSPHILRQHVERIRDDLLFLPGITEVELAGVPPPEISIEISENTLRRYGLTLQRVAEIVRAASVDLPGGSVKTPSGEVLLRTKERRYYAREYEDVVVISQPDGSLVRLGSIAALKETFAETDQKARFDGKPSALVEVFRTGEESPLQIAEAVQAYVDQERLRLPQDIELGIWFDRSLMLKGRLNLLLRNLGLGLILVIVVLGLFLEPRLAFWVTMGIPISVLGALLLMPQLGVSINMITLFAFILVLGIVVDDAIVVGENAHIHRMMGKDPTEAAVDGAIEVGRPVTFSVLTTIAAFMPLLFTKGMMGKFMASIPIIVISVLSMSLLESLLILPAHLSHPARPAHPNSPLAKVRRSVNRRLEWFVTVPYRRLLDTALHHRYLTVAFGLAILAITIGLIKGGHIRQTFLPEVEGDVVRSQLTMPFGTPAAITERHLVRLQQTATRLIAQYDAELPADDEHKPTIVRNIMLVVGQHLRGGGPNRGTITSSGGHLGEVAVYLKDLEDRNVSSQEFARAWAEETGEIPGAEVLNFRSNIAHMGAPIGFQLAHEDFGVLEQAAARVMEALRGYDGLYDIADSHEQGKQQLELKIRPEARSLGISPRELALQVRGAFYGAEALRLQRKRNEVKVMVRYPLDERQSLANTYNMRIRTNTGDEIPFEQAAYIDEGHSYSQIQRSDRKRTITITANANTSIANPKEIVIELWQTLLPQLASDYPGLTYEQEGEQRERAESFASFGFRSSRRTRVDFRTARDPPSIVIRNPF